MMDGYNQYPWMTIIPLILVCLAAWLVTRLIARRGQQFTQGRYAQIKDSLHIGKDKNIIIIEAGSKYYLVGVTNQSMQLLSEIEKSELMPLKGKIENAENPQSVRGALLKFIARARSIKNAPAELHKAQKAAKATRNEDDAEHSGAECEESSFRLDEHSNEEYITGAEQRDNKRLNFAPKASRRGGDSVTIIDTIPIPDDLENEFERRLYEAEKSFDDGGVYVDVSPAAGIVNTLLDGNGSKTVNEEETVTVKKRLFAKRQKKDTLTKQEEDDIDRLLLSIGQRTQMLREKRYKDKEDDLD